MATIREQCMGVKDYVIEMRRKLHQIPELGINNPQTQAFICAELDKMGVPYQKNTVVHDGVQDTGVVAFIEGKNTDKVIALRADVDALPVLEKLDVPYKSQHEGQMHACGHDNHCAMLLGAAKVLSQIKDQLNGSVKLLHPPARSASPARRCSSRAVSWRTPRSPPALPCTFGPSPSISPAPSSSRTAA